VAAARSSTPPPPCSASPAASHLRPPPQTSGTFVPWRLLAKAAPRHSILIWLGDFPPRIEPEGWSVLSRRYQTMGFRVEDPWDRELPFDRILTTYDPVAGRLVNLNGASSAQRAAHAEWVQSRDASFHAIFPNVLSRLTVRTDEERLEALVRFFHRRMSRREAPLMPLHHDDPRRMSFPGSATAKPVRRRPGAFVTWLPLPWLQP
jgi:hypothetical protein